jgi:NSS family neurotransmitter:Na+ symporter
LHRCVKVADVATGGSGLAFVVFPTALLTCLHRCVKVADVATGGSGLAFVVFPTALATLPAPHVFSALFFVMLLSLGLSSSVALVESLKAVLLQGCPSLRRWSQSTSAALCALGWLMGLCMTTSDGRFYLDIVSE